MREAEEIEIKYRLAGRADEARVRERLMALGATGGRRVREQNELYDAPNRTFAREGRVLRVRVLDGGPRGLLTYKGPASYEGALKRRVELETVVADAAATQSLLLALGYRPTVAYSKERETWVLDGVEVALDRLEIGYFCEVEGQPVAIAQVAAALGLAADRAERAGYPTLVTRHGTGIASRLGEKETAVKRQPPARRVDGSRENVGPARLS